MGDDRGVGADDLLAQLRHAGPHDADAAPLERLAASGASVRSLSELEFLCPPERIGISRGAYVALFSPLFGEFE
jgi:hypothetical protein